MTAYTTFIGLLNDLRRALETTNEKARHEEEIRVVGYRMELEEALEEGGVWKAEILVIANTTSDVNTITSIITRIEDLMLMCAKLGIILFVRSITSLDDTTPTTRKSLAVELEAAWRD